MKINILLPVYNDWESLNFLLTDIQKKLNFFDIDVIIVDDCSTIDPFINRKLAGLNIKILKLNKNVGSQKAINIGLNYLKNNFKHKDYCIVMDSDGEDKAEDIIDLIDLAEKNKDKIIFASRGKRQDGLIFYILYRFYLFLFFLLTGKNINCGNFSCIPQIKIKELLELNYSGIHHSASILKSDLGYKKFTCHRGKRYKGRSQMSLSNLILHGLNSMAIFYELIKKRFYVSVVSAIFFLSLMICLTVLLKDLTVNNAVNLIINSHFFLIVNYFFLIFIVFLIYLKYMKNKLNRINFKNITVEEIKVFLNLKK